MKPYMNVGPLYMEPIVRQQYQEICLIEAYVTQYGAGAAGHPGRRPVLRSDLHDLVGAAEVRDEA